VFFIYISTLFIGLLIICVIKLTKILKIICNTLYLIFILYKNINIFLLLQFNNSDKKKNKKSIEIYN